MSEILKRVMEEKRPSYACTFSESMSFGNPSELAAVATSLFVGNLYY